MRKNKRIFTLLALVMILSLCACGSKAALPTAAPETPAEATPAAVTEPAGSNPEAFVGEYTFFCARFSAAYMDKLFELGGAVNDIPDQYVAMPERKGETVTLKGDGTGYLYWGENNQGSIDWWKVEGSAISFQAGVAVIEGTVDRGLMTLTLDDGFALCFAAPGADITGIEPISVDTFAAMLRDGQQGANTQAPAELPIEGAYELFAVENMGALVYSADLEMFSTMNLAAGGTGSMSYGEETMNITSWTEDGGKMTVTMADGGSAGASVQAGIIRLDINGTGEMLLYYAREGADTSGYSPMTMEEYKATNG